MKGGNLLRVPMSVKIRLYRPVVKASTLHKKLDETLQFIAINNDVFRLLTHDSYSYKAHSALSIMQDDFSTLSKIILFLKITRVIHDAIFKTYRKRIDTEVKSRGPLFSILLGILAYLIFADNCSVQKESI